RRRDRERERWRDRVVSLSLDLSFSLSEYQVTRDTCDEELSDPCSLFPLTRVPSPPSAARRIRAGPRCRLLDRSRTPSCRRTALRALARCRCSRRHSRTAAPPRRAPPCADLA